MVLRAARGATCLTEDTPEAMRQAVGELLHCLVTDNAIEADDVCAVFFSATEDLHSLSPAKVAREVLPWQHVALFCAVEPRIEGLPTQVVRVMVQFETERTPAELVHRYLNGAQVLRPDRGCGNPN